ncbi:MAG TPA: divalent-cation tolerance protein CutA [Longimicrobiales bacterium]|nr:divalent-cation tolerance protein CutA [Longimicrobiales bacterium]
MGGSAEAEAPDARVALVTAPDAESAEALVRALVEEGLAACGNIVGGVTSFFRWQGALESASEVLIILKTTAAAAPRLTVRVPELHPYDVPEVLVLAVESGHRPYLSWLGENVTHGG